jgi:Ribonuclease G/E
MDTELAIYKKDGDMCIVLLEDGHPVEFIQDDQQSRLHRMDIFLGQIRQIVPALNCAFVDIGIGRDGMLTMDETGAFVKPGQRMIVQVKKLAPDGQAAKGHVVTGKIQLPGPFAVYIPQGSAKKRSKLESFEPAERQRLFERDLARLRQLWQKLEEDGETGPAPRLLLAAGDPLHVALISLISSRLTKIHIEGQELFNLVYDRMSQLMPSYLKFLTLHVSADDYGLAAVFSLTDLAERIKDRRVWLNNGGYLCIDRTEALTAIDVNSGKDTRGKDSGILRQRTNLLAAVEIARQLRLRNIGGIILIDFIHIADADDRLALLAAFQEAVSRDRARCRIAGFSNLGLLEMTRCPV